MPYANGTSVPADRSRAELEKLLRAAGCSRLAFGHDGDLAVVTFDLGGRVVRLSLSVPALEHFKKKTTRRRWTSGGYEKPDAALQRLREQEERRLWRVLVLLVKAKLETIGQGLSTVEREFLADVVVNGRTIGDQLTKHLDQIYSGEGAPRLLLGMGPR